MIKHYVLDTNVLLYDANAINMFEDNNVHIPMIVLEELDQFKKEMSDLGVNARKTISYLDGLRQKGSLSNGVPLESGGTLYVSSSKQSIDSNFSTEYPDNKLLQLSSYLKTLNHGTKVILVTKDINLRVKADVLGIDAQDYQNPSEGNGVDYDGVKEIIVDDLYIDQIYNDGYIELPYETKDMTENQYVILLSRSNEKRKGLGVYRKGQILEVRRKIKAAGIAPKNTRQAFALEALLNPEIKVVTLSGISGTGKTILSVAAAIQQTIFEEIYNRITITRPIIPVGKEIGFLPGDENEKLAPWTKPIYDSIDCIKDIDRKSGKSKISSDKNPEDYMEIAPLCYIRGRSLINTFMITDECQNLYPLEIKTIATRVGSDTKIIFTGDVYQIDSPYLNKYSNGLSQLIKKFKGQKFYAHITLTDGERSEVAEAAAKLL